MSAALKEDGQGASAPLEAASARVAHAPKKEGDFMKPLNPEDIRVEERSDPPPMDISAAISAEAAAQPTDGPRLASVHDVVRLYNLVLRRNPESEQVISEKVGKALPSLFDNVFTSNEHSMGLAAQRSITSLSARPYRGETNFRKLIGWAVDNIPFSLETRRGLESAASWEDVDLVFMQDGSLCERFPAYNDRDVRRDIELRALQSYLQRLPKAEAMRLGMGLAEPVERPDSPKVGVARLLENADLFLQLGKALRRRDQRPEAIQAYRRSLALEPSLAAVTELKELDVDVDISELRAPARDPEILFEISDLFSDLLDNVTISGIQRIQLGIISYILSEREAGRALDCQLVWWVNDDLYKLDAKSLVEVMQIYQRPEVQDVAHRRKTVKMLNEQGDLVIPVPGDILISTGVIYRQPNLVLTNARLQRAGVRLGAYIHDFIPLTHPEYCDRGLTEAFSKTISVALLQYDFALTVSAHVEREMRRLLTHSGYPEIPIREVPEHHAIFGQEESAGDDWTPAVAELDGVDFVLCVGTFSGQKNQALLVQVWQILIREGVEPPVLVLVGRRGHNVIDLMSQLATSRNLDGRVKILEGLRDSELQTLYRNCLFTMQPSLAEGWGLPVGESLAAGKLCIASNAASIPEVGGEFALYIDPHDARGAANLVRRLLLDRAELRRLEEKIRTEFKPRTREEHVASLIAAVRALAGGEQPKSLRSKPITMPFSRAVRPFNIETGWEYGAYLPPWQVAADKALRRLLLEKGWYPHESWGTWMKGGLARLGFTIESQTKGEVRVALQFRGAPWANSNQFTIRSRCGASVTTRLPDAQGYPEFLVWLDCMANESGRVELSLEVLGSIPDAWWGDTRQFCVGLVRVICFPQPDIDAPLPANKLLRPAASLRLFGTLSMIAAMRHSGMLANGWFEPRPGRAQMLGTTARVVLQTAANPEETVRVVLRLRAQAGQSGEIIVESDSGAQTRLGLLPGDPSEFSIWLDCRVDARQRAGLTIKARAFSSGSQVLGRVFSLILFGAAYGRRDGDDPSGRLQLVEALMFPDPQEERETFRKAYDRDLRISVAGHVNGSYSLAVTNRRLALALEDARPGTVRIEQVEEGRYTRDLSRIPAAERARVAALARREWHEEGPHVEITQHWPVWAGSHQADLRLAWVPWEESLVPADMVQFLNRRFEGVLVQTRFVAKALIDSGVRVRLRLMGYAPDLDDFVTVGAARPNSVARERPTKKAPFVFLHVSSCFPRKGVDTLLAAYARAFRSGDCVRLVIKTFPNPHNDVPEQMKAMQELDPDLPEIVLINRDLPTHEVAELYRQADAVVLPTRGEGFNLPAAEALAARVPLIVTGHSGHVDFVSPDVARLVDFRFVPSKSHVSGEGSVWVDPDPEDLALAMQELFNAAHSAYAWSSVMARAERGQRAALALGDAAAWADRVREVALDLLCSSRADTPHSPTVAWVTTWNVPCGIATHSSYLLQRYPDAIRDVVVLCDERTLPQDLTAPGKPAARIAWRLGDPTSAVRIAKEVAAIGAAAVVIQHQRGLIKTDVLTALLLDERLSGREIILVLHNPRELVEFDGWEPLRDALRRVSRVVVHGVMDLNLLKSWGLVDNVTLLPPGALRSAVKLRPSRDLPDSAAPVIGTYGFAFADKGVGELIEAFARLRNEWPGAQLRMVTAEHPSPESVDEIARCRALAQRLGVSDAIDWRTQYLPDEESLALLNGCDLIVLPRRETPESASGAVRISMASRVPVMVTPVRIFQDLGESVLRATGLDASAMSASIAAALRDRTLRDRAVAQADRWLEAHDWARLSERLHGMICGLAVNPQFRTDPERLI